MTADDELLALLADVLVPAEGPMPAASSAGVPGTGLDAVLLARPDLAAPLDDILVAGRGLDPAAYVARLRATDPSSFGVLTTAVAGGYLQDREVQRLLGYTRRESAPLDEPDVTPAFEADLLAPVRAAGPRYRPTPREDRSGAFRKD